MNRKSTTLIACALLVGATLAFAAPPKGERVTVKGEVVDMR